MDTKELSLEDQNNEDVAFSLESMVKKAEGRVHYEIGNAPAESWNPTHYFGENNLG